jgi:hypothetical protein
VKLFSGQEWGLECRETIQVMGRKFDFQASLASLPRIFGTRMETIPADVPYLRADAARAAEWERRVAEAAGGKRRLGLVWQGKRRPDPFRSTTLEALGVLGRVTGNWFCSLQKREASGQSVESPQFEMADWTNELQDFADTAALIDRLDLIITIDTSVAHLAGAMGKPTWVLLRHTPDWRWMMDREESPWYPTMRLFRQRCLGDWAGPVKQIADALESL